MRACVKRVCSSNQSQDQHLSTWCIPLTSWATHQDVMELTISQALKTSREVLHFKGISILLSLFQLFLPNINLFLAGPYDGRSVRYLILTNESKTRPIAFQLTTPSLWYIYYPKEGIIPPGNSATILIQLLPLYGPNETDFRKALYDLDYTFDRHCQMFFVEAAFADNATVVGQVRKIVSSSIFTSVILIHRRLPLAQECIHHQEWTIGKDH